jgi:cytochrome c556
MNLDRFLNYLIRKKNLFKNAVRESSPVGKMWKAQDPFESQGFEANQDQL